MLREHGICVLNSYIQTYKKNVWMSRRAQHFRQVPDPGYPKQASAEQADYPSTPLALIGHAYLLSRTLHISQGQWIVHWRDATVSRYSVCNMEMSSPLLLYIFIYTFAIPPSSRLNLIGLPSTTTS